jgi:uncharacterized membrane protein YhaH (DUF805 family)
MGRMFHWMLMPYRRYVDFNGRSQRIEYWLFMLFYWIAIILLFALIMAGLPWDDMTPDEVAEPVPAMPGPLTWVGVVLMFVFMIGSLVPSIAVTVRRFHDQDKTGWLYLLNFIPYVGPFVILVFMCIEGTRGPNSYGEDPKDPHHERIFE